MENLLHFHWLENLPVPHIERFLTSNFIVNYLFVVLNISTFCLVLLVVSFPCKSYLSFIVPG
jgi:hypothetical protein